MIIFFSSDYSWTNFVCLKAAQDAGMNVVMIPDTEAVVKSVDVISSLGKIVVAYRVLRLYWNIKHHHFLLCPWGWETYVPKKTRVDFSNSGEIERFVIIDAQIKQFRISGPNLI